MKREYEFLNEVRVNFSDYEALPFTEQERSTMKKNLKEANQTHSYRKHLMWAAACAACLVITSQTAFAKELAEKIFSLGHSSILVDVESDTDTLLTAPIPDALKGQIFDAEGNEITEFTSDMTEIFDADGEKVLISHKVTDGMSEYSLEKYSDADSLSEDDGIIAFSSVEDLEAHLSFDLKIPSVLPDGFTLSKASGFAREDGSVSPDYAVLQYHNGTASFTIHERRDAEETQFTTDMPDALEIAFQGTTAICNHSEFAVCLDETIVSILGNTVLTGDALLDVANSLE